MAMTLLLVGLGACVTFALLCVRLTRHADPLRGLGTVKGHREVRRDWARRDWDR